MYAYVDETGNTGQNLFDPSQPFFLTAALITKTNFNLLYKKDVQLIRKKLGVTALHANELGIWRIEEIAADILHILKKADARIFLSRIVKKDLAATKLFDTIFDSGENLAVNWHNYNNRPLRLLLTIKVAYLLDEPLLMLFWNSLMEKQKHRANELFMEVLKELSQRAEILPDERSRTIVKESVQWALNNPEAIHFHINSRIHKQGHLPNIAAFPQLLGGIEEFSKIWKRPVREIIHDRQTQFGKTLETWHEIISNAAPGSITIFNETISVRKVPDSKFILSTSEDSSGLQIIDIILWLFKQIYDFKSIPPNCAKLMAYVSKKSLFFDLSLESIRTVLADFFQKMDELPMTVEQQKNAEEFLKISEERRQDQMNQYSKQKMNLQTSD